MVSTIELFRNEQKNIFFRTGGRARAEWMALEIADPSTDPVCIFAAFSDIICMPYLLKRLVGAGNVSRVEGCCIFFHEQFYSKVLLKEDELRSATRDAKHVFNSLVDAVRDACRGVDDGVEKVGNILEITAS